MNGNQKFHKPTGPAFIVGEVWHQVDRSPRTVTIVEVHSFGPGKWDYIVWYKDTAGNVFGKDAWNFQVRYFHSADKELKVS